MQAWDWKTIGKVVGFAGLSVAAILVGRRVGEALAKDLGPALREVSRLGHLRRAVAASRSNP